MAKSKLYRNLKPGDKFQVIDLTFLSTHGRTHTVTVTSVQETKRAWFTNRRQWAIHGNYPWWFGGPIMAYSDDRVELMVESGVSNV